MCFFAVERRVCWLGGAELLGAGSMDVEDDAIVGVVDDAMNVKFTRIRDWGC
jgi:hypothetical protein